MIFSIFRWNSSTLLELSSPVAAYLYFRKQRLNILTGFMEDVPVSSFKTKLESFSLQGKCSLPRVYHYYYDYGLLEAGLGHLVHDDTPLVLELEYKKHRKHEARKPRLKSLHLQNIERPSWSEYKEAFGQVQEELLAGNCYQVNLTYPFDFITEEMLDPRDVVDFFFAQPGTSPYAHATFFGDGLILSNSPECLFQYQDNEIFTMPIKGTIKSKPSEFSKKWKQLIADPKEEGELLMITDLLRNDLNLLSDYRAKVRKLRAPLQLPGLIHQYSLISAKLPVDVSLTKTMEALFPGGSITGAPKKRVMEIIARLERYQRGIYCGSTVLCMGRKKAASINIRTAMINLEERTWRYGAGGGVTLLSQAVGEFQEMELKVASFMKLLKVPGY
jgi:para-aminobenzoate synthetase component I